MKLSTFDISRIKALHYLLEEEHVGRAASRLGITPAAASNALRRLREDFGDPLLAPKGRGLVRTRVGDELREPTREAVDAVARLLHAARPFEPALFQGELMIAMAEHVAAPLSLHLDRLTRERAPLAKLVISSIPDDVSGWLERRRGVLVGPIGRFAAAAEEDTLTITKFYEDRYVSLLRRGHRNGGGPWDAATFAGLDHVLVTPRGRTLRSDIDDRLAELGLSRAVTRVAPSFSVALPLVAQSDLIASAPRLYAERMPFDGLILRPLPFDVRPLTMAMITHPAHDGDAAVAFCKDLLRQALRSVRAVDG